MTLAWTLSSASGSTLHRQADGPISFQASTKPKNREKRNEYFVMRDERFRILDTKSLKSLRAPNQGFRGIVCFQTLNRHFVSRFRRMLSLDPKRSCLADRGAASKADAAMNPADETTIAVVSPSRLQRI
jgi:hypothetical protein